MLWHGNGSTLVSIDSKGRRAWQTEYNQGEGTGLLLPEAGGAAHLCAQACVCWFVAGVNAEPKVSQLDGTLACQQHVLKLDVPVGGVGYTNGRGGQGGWHER